MNLSIRIAVPEDLPAIYSLYSRIALDHSRLGNVSYEETIQKQGFLMGIDTKEDITKTITDAHHFLLAYTNDQLVGYLVTDHKEKFYDDEYKTWFDPGLKDRYYHDPKSMSIQALVVEPTFGRQGIATRLLAEELFTLTSQGFTHLFSIITLAPITNCPTIAWHTKHGFKRMAMGRPRRLFDLDNYVGVLLYKSLL